MCNDCKEIMSKEEEMKLIHDAYVHAKIDEAKIKVDISLDELQEERNA